MQKANCWLEGAAQTTYTYDVANELLKELVGDGADGLCVRRQRQPDLEADAERVDRLRLGHPQAAEDGLRQRGEIVVRIRGGPLNLERPVNGVTSSLRFGLRVVGKPTQQGIGMETHLRSPSCEGENISSGA